MSASSFCLCSGEMLSERERFIGGLWFDESSFDEKLLSLDSNWIGNDEVNLMHVMYAI